MHNLHCKCNNLQILAKMQKEADKTSKTRINIKRLKKPSFVDAGFVLLNYTALFAFCLAGKPDGTGVPPVPIVLSFRCQNRKTIANCQPLGHTRCRCAIDPGAPGAPPYKMYELLFCPSRAFSRVRASNTAAGKPGATVWHPYRSLSFYALNNRWAMTKFLRIIVIKTNTRQNLIVNTVVLC